MIPNPNATNQPVNFGAVNFGTVMAPTPAAQPAPVTPKTAPQPAQATNPDTFKAMIVAEHPNGVASDGRAYTAIPAAELTHMVVAKYPNGVTNDGRKYSDFLAAPAAPTVGSAGQALPASAPISADANLKSLSDAVSSIFPGQKIGQAIGTLSGYGIATLKDFVNNLQGHPTTYAKNFDISAPSPVQTIGDAAQAALTVAAPEIGGGGAAGIGGAATRVAANTALGAGLGATGSIANNDNPSDVLKNTAIGAGTGGLISGASEAVGTIAKNLPTWLAQSALPKIRDTSVPYALDNAGVGSTKQLLAKSDGAVQSYSGQIRSILQHPQYANETGNAKNIMSDVLSAFPNSKLDAPQVTFIVSRVVPGSATLVDKVAAGTATLSEQNTLRSQLDMATKKVFTDSPNLTFNKQVAHTLADSLRSNVQSSAPETKSIFANFSKELDLNKALTSLDRKNNLKPTFKDLAAAYAGYQTDGIPGALTAVAGERLIGSGAVRLSAGTILNKTSKVAPLLKGVVSAAKASVIKKATDKTNQ